MASKRNPAIGFIFITLVIDVLGIGLIIPILPTLIRGFTGGDLSTASQYSGWLMASYAIMQFFSLLFWVDCRISLDAVPLF